MGKIFDTFKFEGKNEDLNSFAHQCIFDNNKDFLFVPTQARAKGYERLNLIKYDFDKFGSSDVRSRLIDRWVHEVKLNK